MSEEWTDHRLGVSPLRQSYRGWLELQGLARWYGASMTEVRGWPWWYIEALWQLAPPELPAPPTPED